MLCGAQISKKGRAGSRSAIAASVSLTKKVSSYVHERAEWFACEQLHELLRPRAGAQSFQRSVIDSAPHAPLIYVQ